MMGRMKTKGMRNGGKVMTKGMRNGGKVMTKGYRNGGRVMTKGGSAGGAKKMTVAQLRAMAKKMGYRVSKA
tara:strand:- start:751 stop:963 length:213 start_codon:yes stop_codon:yes gene_type:complete